MDSSATSPIMRSEECLLPNSQATNSKGKTICFAIAIILSLGGLAVAGIGLGGYLQIGPLLNFSQINSISIMVAGGSCGIILLIVGVAGSVKNCQTNGRDNAEDTEDVEDNPAPPNNAELTAPPKRAAKTHDRSIYGKDAWEVWGVKVLDVVPPPPNVDTNNKILLYIPQKVKFNGKEDELTLNVFSDITKDMPLFIGSDIKKNFGNTLGTGKWILIDTNVTPASLKQDYNVLRVMLQQDGCRMPSILEAVVLNLMVFAHTKTPLYKDYTYCLEYEGEYLAIMVGSFITDLIVVYGCSKDENCGVVSVREF
jgi:hypothetical protein